jgi:hypothetical protein
MTTALTSIDGTELRTEDSVTKSGLSYDDGFCDETVRGWDRCSRHSRFIVDGWALCGIHANCLLNRHHAPRDVTNKPLR